MTEQGPQYRNFDEEFPVKEVDQLTFTLGGRKLTTKKYLHPKALIFSERGVAAAVEVLHRTLDTESRVAFDELIEDPDGYLSSEQLDEAGSWVLRYLSGAVSRPTTPPSPSGVGQEPTVLTSVDASS